MILVANKTGTTDGPAYQFISQINSPIPLVLVSRANDFVFNEELLKLDRWVLVDYTEYNWDWDRKETHIWGKNTDKFPYVFPGDEWKRFDDFVISKPPVLIFKRELLKKDASETLLPIEYPNWIKPIALQSREEFNARPFSVFFFWGRSHEARVKLHGNIWLNASSGGYSVCDSLNHIRGFVENEEGEKWVTLNIPHYARIPIESILQMNGASKLSISMPGAGVKCFRSTGESGANSTMVMQRDDLAWTHEWIDGHNCIQFNSFGEEIETIKSALRKEDLYLIYINCVATSNQYYLPTYIDHLEKLINERV